MGINVITEQRAVQLRAQFEGARDDIKGDCVKYHYPLLEIKRALDSAFDAPLPKEALESIGIPAREFQELHALAFALETVRGGPDTPETVYKRTYLTRHLKCLDASTPDSLGNLLPETMLARLQRNVTMFAQKNPELMPK